VKKKKRKGLSVSGWLRRRLKNMLCKNTRTQKNEGRGPPEPAGDNKRKVGERLEAKAKVGCSEERPTRGEK
jgi:hypothetical protein